MYLRLSLAVAALAISSPIVARTELEQGLDGALRGCEEWVLNPGSWAEGTEPFEATVGLGGKMSRVQTAVEVQLPPKELRAANHYWRINSTPDAGYMLVVSDQLPMCHITGGGNVDLQPTVETTLASKSFNDRWEKIGDRSKDDLISTEFRNRGEPDLTMVVSRAMKSGQRLDRVQILATATMSLND